MKIRGWHIDGFGIHRNWRVDALPGGLEVFYGPNEAGKSTLLAFLRGVLFGYPDGRSSDPKYEPKDAVAHGGRITLETPAGEVVVERFAGRGKKFAVTLEDGRSGSEAELSARLGRADARLFRSVFAFGLRELQELGALGEAGIQDHLFAAGVTGAGRPARESARELRKAARELFDGPKGRKKTDRARLVIAEISQLNALLYARQEAAETYPALRDRLALLDAAQRELSGKEEAARQVEQRAKRLGELWNELWCPLAEAREQAAKLAPSLPENLPQNARVRLDEGLVQVQREEERLELLRAERAALARQLEELLLDDAAFAVAPRVEALKASLSLDESQRERLAALEVECDGYAQRVRATLDELIPGNEGDDDASREVALRAVQSTLQRREELRSWKAREDEHASSIRERAAAARLLDEQLDAGRARLEEIQRRVLAEPEVDHAGLEERLAAARALRALAPGLREAEARLAEHTTALAGSEAQSSLLPGGLVATFVAGLVTLAAVAGFVFVDRLELAAIALVLALGVGGLRVARKRAEARAQASLQRSLHELLLSASERVESLRTEAASHLSVLALERLDEEALSRIDASLSDERARAEAGRRSSDERSEAQAQLSRLEGQRRDLGDSIAAARAALAAVEGDFAVWKQDAQFPPELGIDAAGEFLEKARRGRDALDERDRLRAEGEGLALQQRAFRTQIDDVLEAASLPEAFSAPLEDEARFAALAAVHERCVRDRAAREGREPLERQAVAQRTRFVECEDALAEARRVVSALLAEVGAPDVAALKRSLAGASEVAELEGRIARTEAEFERRLEGVEAIEAAFLREELARGAEAAWEQQGNEARGAAAALRQERDEVLKEHAALDRDRVRLEQSTDVVDLEIRKTALEQELRDVLDEWRQLRVAAQLLEESVRRFEEVHQPGVLREASSLFERVTAGRYPRIVQTEGKEGFAVLTAEGLHRSPAELSQGTSEQLYLCVRLGLVLEMARAGRALPVVMDDVLVNFDDERARAMAEVLGVFAQDHQILFFTCSSRTRDLLAAAPNGALHPIGAV